jgi:hypothetical protein
MEGRDRRQYHRGPTFSSQSQHTERATGRKPTSAPIRCSNSRMGRSELTLYFWSARLVPG